MNAADEHLLLDQVVERFLDTFPGSVVVCIRCGLPAPGSTDGQCEDCSTHFYASVREKNLDLRRKKNVPWRRGRWPATDTLSD
jgi:NMD protein affecting ribosome stability and mRNA decay